MFSLVCQWHYVTQVNSSSECESEIKDWYCRSRYRIGPDRLCRDSCGKSNVCSVIEFWLVNISNRRSKQVARKLSCCFSPPLARLALTYVLKRVPLGLWRASYHWPNGRTSKIKRELWSQTRSSRMELNWIGLDWILGLVCAKSLQQCDFREPQCSATWNGLLRLFWQDRQIIHHVASSLTV